MAINRNPGRLGLCLLLALPGCWGGLRVKTNLAEGQVTHLGILRKPSGEKSLGVVPKYDEYLEGYITGGFVTPDGKPVEGVVVKVLDEKTGNPNPDFSDGVTGKQGVWRIRFSLPVRWNRIDVLGRIRAEGGWEIALPQSAFRLYFNRSLGLLAYFPREYWVPVKNPALKPPAPPVPKVPRTEPPKKNPDDPFGDFKFGP